ncbi:hypothetical protein Tco_0143672 [Tanacetum coccineum]
MNQNNEDRQLSVFEIDANDDETDVVFLEQAYAYHQQLVVEENRLPLTRNLINRDREGAEERLMADYFNDHCSYGYLGFFGCECECEKADVAPHNLVLPSYGSWSSKSKSYSGEADMSKDEPGPESIASVLVRQRYNRRVSQKYYVGPPLTVWHVTTAGSANTEEVPPLGIFRKESINSADLGRNCSRSVNFRHKGLFDIPNEILLSFTLSNNLFQAKRILLDVKLVGMLADLRSSFEDSFFGDYIIGVLFRLCDVTRLDLAQVPYLLSEDIVALCFNAFSILYIVILCYDDQSLRHDSSFRLSRGVTG